MKKKYHVISAKNFGYESALGDGTYDYFVFPADEFSQYDAMGTFEEVTKETLKANNHWYSYLAVGEASKAMNAVEKSVLYYIDLYNTCEGEKVLQRSNIKSPVVRETELITSLPKEIIKQKLLNKLSKNEIQALNQETRFLELLDIVNNLS